MIGDVALGRRLQHELRILRAAREPWNTTAAPAIETRIAATLAELWIVEGRLAEEQLLLTPEGELVRIPVAA